MFDRYKIWILSCELLEKSEMVKAMKQSEVFTRIGARAEEH